MEAAKEKINEAIANHFDIQTFFGSKNPVCIVDLGCSTGANTFITVQNIVEAIKLKYKSKGVNAQIPDFLVFFNDNVSNDFNTLFKSLPPNRQYFAAGTGFFPWLPVSQGIFAFDSLLLCTKLALQDSQ